MPRQAKKKKRFREVNGVEVPMHEGTNRIQFTLGPGDWEKAVPGDADHCVIALRGKEALNTPHFRVKRKITEVAVPDKRGVPIPGWEGLWVVRRYENCADAKAAIIKLDTGEAIPEHAVVTLKKPRPSYRPKGQAKKNEDRTARREARGQTDWPKGDGTKRDDVLTERGVRKFRGDVQIN